jgi:hypothetical protein
MDKTMIATVPTDDCLSQGQAETNPRLWRGCATFQREKFFPLIGMNTLGELGRHFMPTVFDALPGYGTVCLSGDSHSAYSPEVAFRGTRHRSRGQYVRPRIRRADNTGRHFPSDGRLPSAFHNGLGSSPPRSRAGRAKKMRQHGQAVAGRGRSRSRRKALHVCLFALAEI